MSATNQYLEFLQEWLSPLGEISARAMFGGHCLYCDGLTFALLAGNTLYLKADELSRAHFTDLGLRPFQPFPDKPEVMQYYPPPPEFFDNGEEMERWGRLAVEAARRAKARKGKRKRA